MSQIKKVKAAKTSLIRDDVARKIDSPYTHASCHEVSKKSYLFLDIIIGDWWNMNTILQKIQLCSALEKKSFAGEELCKLSFQRRSMKNYF